METKPNGTIFAAKRRSARSGLGSLRMRASAKTIVITSPMTMSARDTMIVRSIV